MEDGSLSPPHKKKRGSEVQEEQEDEEKKEIDIDNFTLPPLCKPPPLVEREYTCFFAVGENEFESGIHFPDRNGVQWEDQYVYQHRNRYNPATFRLCIVGVADTHPLLRQEKKVVRLNFVSSEHGNPLEYVVKGKGKKNALRVQPDDVLCEVECADGSKYQLRSCVKGQLLELNANLASNPDLLTKQAATEGFLAIIKVNESEDPAKVYRLLSLEEFIQRRTTH